MNAHLQSDKIEKMDEIQDGLSYSLGKSDVSITELMSIEFITGNTKFNSWQSFLDAAHIKNEDDFERAEFNEFVKRNTRFENWEEMLVQASNRFTEIEEKRSDTI